MLASTGKIHNAGICGIRSQQGPGQLCSTQDRCISDWICT